MVKEISDQFVDLVYEAKNNSLKESIFFQNYVAEKNEGVLIHRYESHPPLFLSPWIKISIYNIKDSTVVQEIPDNFFKKQIGFRIAGENKEEAVNFIKEFYKDYTQVEK